MRALLTYFAVLSCLALTNANAQSPILERSIDLRPDVTASDGITVCDLDGDGAFDFIVRHPPQQSDPWNWNLTTETVKIDAYRSTGEFLWRYDMGWGIENGVHFAPVFVFDLNQDGRDEVFVKWSGGDARLGEVHSTDEWVVQLDGLTGEEIQRAPFVKRDVTHPDETHLQVAKAIFSNESRNMLFGAYLDGEHAALIVGRGTYRGEGLIAYDQNLQKIWEWYSTDMPDAAKWSGQGTHGWRAADVDGDGRDEIVVGAMVIDEYGKGLWTMEKGHIDICHVADINWENPGLEIFMAWEKHRIPGAPNDVALVDAKTGTYLWGSGADTVSHAHGQGLCGELLPEVPGLECYAREQDGSQTWFYDAAGNRLENSLGLEGTSPRAISWDSRGTEIPLGQTGLTMGPAARRGLIADILGDGREEWIIIEEGRINIYSTPHAPDRPIPSLITDRQYRLDQGRGQRMSGYYYTAQVSRLTGPGHTSPTTGTSGGD